MAKKVSTDVKTGIRDYWHKSANRYDKYPGHKDNEEVKEAYRKVLEKALKRDKLNILDVGTGTGFLALLLAEAGHKVTGLDLTEGMLEIAKSKAGKLGLSINFQLGDAEVLPFSDELFDAVVCRHVLWTLPNPQKALTEWVRVVRLGGQIIALEGKWRDSLLISHFRLLIYQLAMLVHERTIRSLHYKKEINNALPLYGGITPEKAINLFQQTGLNNISVEDLQWIREIQRKGMPFLYRLAFSHPMFLIKGSKESGF